MTSVAQPAAPWVAWGLALERVERPSTPEELADCLRSSGERRQAVLPVGAGSALASGGWPEVAPVAISLEGLADLVDYAPGDLTVTVLAGMPLASLRETLAARGQWLPGSEGGRGTVGGLLASGYSAPDSRESWGSLRERTLGTRVAGVDGSLTRSGGRVVKNVTGFDLHRMHAGAGGALGILTEICFRVEPRPEARLEVEVDCPSWSAAQEAWLWLRRKGPEVACLRVRVTQEGEPVLRALLLGDAEPVREAADLVAAGWGAYGATRAEGAPGEEAPASVSDPTHAPARLALRLFLPPSRIVEAHEALRLECAARGLHVDTTSYPNLGEIDLALGGKPADLVGAWTDVAQGTRQGRWHYRVEDQSQAFEASPPAWSADPAALRLLAKLKLAVDPHDILRPGSYSAAALRQAAEFFER